MDKTKPTLYLIRGVSGAGKSTFAQTLLQAGIIDKVIEADDWFMYGREYHFNRAELKTAHEYCQLSARSFLKVQRSVAIANTSTTSMDVKTYQNVAKEYNANFVSLIVENRNNTQSVHNVPPETLARQRAQFAIQL